METHLILAGIAFLGTSGLASCLLIRAYVRHTLWASEEKPLWKKCGPCEGCGAVMIDGSPIPLEHRSFYRTRSNTAKAHGIIQGPLANARTCTSCLGMGSAWHYRGSTRTSIPSVKP